MLLLQVWNIINSNHGHPENPDIIMTSTIYIDHYLINKNKNIPRYFDKKE